MKIRFIIGLIFLTQLLKCQSQFNNWYFGTNAGLTFASGSPVALINGQTSTIEGVATMSDASGNLLFYTDGVTVYNRLHMVMTNGNGLNGNSSSTQSAIIVEWPSNPNKYFIFTSTNDAGPNGICYSVVDMSLSATLGAITTKNFQIRTPSCEKLCAVRHCNNRDIWILTHDWASNVYRSFLVDPSGVNSTAPVLSATGWLVSGPTQSGYGQLKSNLFGNKIANAYYGNGSRIEVGDFNNATGVVSNMQMISYETGAYGCEFSPNGRIVYCSTNSGVLTQFNLCAGTLAQITASRYVVASTGAFMGSLQIGPDMKVYLARNQTALSVINNPNNVGLSCSYSDLSVPLANRNSRFCLPNFASYYNRPRDDFIASINCLSVDFIAPIVNVGICSLNSAITAYLWRFGDGQMSTIQNPIHTYSASGTYSVSLELQYSCYRDTIQIPITVSGSNQTVITTITQP